MNAAERDHIRFRIARLVAEPQGIAYKVRKLLDVAGLVIMG